MISIAINPLPDLLMDHTLLSESLQARMTEYLGRWVQLVNSLWPWHERKAAFALRMTGGLPEGTVTLRLLAVCEREAEASLKNTLEQLLGVHLGLDSIQITTDDASLPKELERDCECIELVQLRKLGFWTVGALLAPSDEASYAAIQAMFAVEGQANPKSPPIILPWWGPGGPFIAPYEALSAAKTPVVVTAYLEPTVLATDEDLYHRLLSQQAASTAHVSRTSAYIKGQITSSDPAADTAARILLAHWRRLTSPFLTSVQICALRGSDQASAVSSTLSSIVQENPSDVPREDEARFPSGVRWHRLDGRSKGQHTRLRFQFAEGWEKDEPLTRMEYLVDARGGASFFRLPVSIRAGVPGLSVLQRSPDFAPGPRLRPSPSDTWNRRRIDLGVMASGGRAQIAVEDLTKHALVTGFTGSGKTKTVLYLLYQLQRLQPRVPWLVIESAKEEYRGFLKTEMFASEVSNARHLNIFTLGSELVSPFRLNPFELLPGVRLEAHVGRLLTCFEAALPPVGPLSSVLIEAMVRVYERNGWRMTDTGPSDPIALGRKWPRIGDFYAVVLGIISGRYTGELQGNMQGAIGGRLKPFTRLVPGSKSFMFDCERSTPAEVLFDQCTILELNSLNESDKSLVSMFLLTMLREHRELQFKRDGDRGLRHVTVVEEAHNVLANVGQQQGESASNEQFKAVQAFCNMLAEIRSLGEGLIIADQSPAKLARDAVRNTNVQIVHQLRDNEDRESMARTMLMSEQQAEFLGRLRPGHAAAFYTTLDRPTFVKVPRFDSADDRDGDYQQLGKGFEIVSDDAVRKHMAAFSNSVMSGPLGPACIGCEAKCHYRDRGAVAANDEHLKSSFISTVKAYWFGKDEERSAPTMATKVVPAVLTVLGRHYEKSGDGKRTELSRRDRAILTWCTTAHLWTDFVSTTFAPPVMGEAKKLEQARDLEKLLNHINRWRPAVRSALAAASK